MRSVCSILALGLVVAMLAGCDKPLPAPKPGQPVVDQQQPAAGQPAVDSRQPAPVEPEAALPEPRRATVKDALNGIQADASDMDLYMHDISPTGDARRKPTLWVHAARGQLKPDSSWTLADARAVIYREQNEDIRLESRLGSFDESKKVAVLEGGVKVDAGAVELQTDSVSYDNAKRVVQTHSPVQLSDGQTLLNAQGATLEPDDGSVTLTDVTGMLSLTGVIE